MIEMESGFYDNGSCLEAHIESRYLICTATPLFEALALTFASHHGNKDTNTKSIALSRSVRKNFPLYTQYV